MMIFILAFCLHLILANKSGMGDKYMSEEFQSSLEGNRWTARLTPVYFGSTVDIINVGEKGIYLHSHVHRYPSYYSDGKASSKGQQITGFHYEALKYNF